jgi:uncharacterized membrane protein
LIGVGLACALTGSAISNWSSPAGSGGSVRDALTVLGAALGVGVTLTLLHAAGTLDPFWVTAVQHLSTAVSAGLVVAVTAARRRGSLPRVSGSDAIGWRQLPILALVAVAGAGGDLAYVAASHRGGQLSIVSAIASLYPLMTIALGWVLAGSRARRTQAIGIALALLGAVLLGAAAG